MSEVSVISTIRGPVLVGAATQTKRKANKNLIIKHHNVSYQLINVGKGHRYVNQNVTVCEKPDGNVLVTWRGKNLSYNIYGEAMYKLKFANRRDVNKAVSKFHFLMHSNISSKGDTNYPTN